MGIPICGLTVVNSQEPDQTKPPVQSVWVFANFADCWPNCHSIVTIHETSKNEWIKHNQSIYVFIYISCTNIRIHIYIHSYLCKHHIYIIWYNIAGTYDKHVLCTFLAAFQSETVGTLTILPSKKKPLCWHTFESGPEIMAILLFSIQSWKTKPSKHENLLSMPDSDNQPNLSRFITKSTRPKTSKKIIPKAPGVGSLSWLSTCCPYRRMARPENEISEMCQLRSPQHTTFFLLFPTHLVKKKLAGFGHANITSKYTSLGSCRCWYKEFFKQFCENRAGPNSIQTPKWKQELYVVDSSAMNQIKIFNVVQ